MKKIVLGTLLLAGFATSLVAGAAGSCIGCHGAKGEKNTLAKQSIPNKLSKVEFIKVMQEYEAGTLNKYGKGSMMKNFARGKNFEAIANEWGLK